MAKSLKTHGKITEKTWENHCRVCKTFLSLILTLFRVGFHVFLRLYS